MDFTRLGRTALKVSRMGLGCGGPSRLGLGAGGSERDAEAVVREALALGVNFLDTAESYGTEEVVGRALQGTDRTAVALSTKTGVRRHDIRTTAPDLKARVEGSLRRLGTEYVDILHLHGVADADYDYAREELVPALLELRTEGKVRFLGITEAFGSDPGHSMLTRALGDACWDVMMVGFNLLNQSARERVLAATREQGIGTLCMFAVRRALSRPESLRETIATLIERGQVDPERLNPADPLGFLLENGGAASLTEAAYRFCRWEPGLDVLLSGTGRIEHLRENAAALERPALPPAVLDRLHRLFAGVDSVSGN